jgi:hypothetical protein
MHTSLKILDTRRVKLSQFHTADPQTLGTTVQNVLSRPTWRNHPCVCGWRGEIWLFIYLFIHSFIYFSLNSRDSVLGVMTCYDLDEPGFELWKNQEIFLVSKSSNPAPEPSHNPIQWAPVFFPGNKAAGA